MGGGLSTGVGLTGFYQVGVSEASTFQSCCTVHVCNADGDSKENIFKADDLRNSGCVQHQVTLAALQERLLSFLTVLMRRIKRVSSASIY